jgi:predicted dehydrogenase
MGRAWAGALTSRPDVRLAGWVDLVPERVAEALEDLGLVGVRVEPDLLLALEACAPDFVVDAAVPEAHHAVTASCLERGVAVLGEKPMAAGLDEARDLVRRAESSGTLFAVSQNRRYDAGLLALRRLVTERLGGAGQVNAEFYRAPRFGGFREEMDSPLLVDMAIHTFDAARFVTGADARSVHCVEFNPPWSWYRGAACAIAEFELDGGARFSYEGSWCAVGHETSWDAAWRVVGPLGSATWDGGGPPVAEIAPPGRAAATAQRVESPPAELRASGIAGSLADFVRGLRTGVAPMTECHDNLKSFAMVSAALESSRCGRRVAVEA